MKTGTNAYNEVQAMAPMDAEAIFAMCLDSVAGGANRGEVARLRYAFRELVDATKSYREGTACHLFGCEYCAPKADRLDAALERIK